MEAGFDGRHGGGRSGGLTHRPRSRPPPAATGVERAPRPPTCAAPIPIPPTQTSTTRTQTSNQLDKTTTTHRGTFHDTTPETNNHIRAKAAFCSHFVPFDNAKLSASKPRAGTADERPGVVTRMAPPVGLTIQGNGTVWQYLYKNKTCNLSGGIQLHAVVLRGGRPAANLSTTGRTHTSTCAEGAGTRFYFDVKGNLTDPGEGGQSGRDVGHLCRLSTFVHSPYSNRVPLPPPRPPHTINPPPHH